MARGYLAFKILRRASLMGVSALGQLRIVSSGILANLWREEPHDLPREWLGPKSKRREQDQVNCVSFFAMGIAATFSRERSLQGRLSSIAVQNETTYL